MSQYQNLLELMGLAAAAALGAAACSGSTNSTTTLLTNQQAAEVAEGVSLDVEGEISDAASTGSVASYSDAPAVGTLGLAAPTCTVIRSPASPPDADADGVPDSVSLALNTCVLTYPAETDTLLGTIVIKDPTLSTPDHNVQRIYSQVERTRWRSGVKSTETWNGTRTMTRPDSSSLTQAETAFTTAFLLPDQSVPTHTRTWTSTFTADVAGSIVANQALPSGTWTINGSDTWTFTNGSTPYVLTLSTTAALHYNATCTATPRIDTGALKATLTQGSRTGVVTITFAGCGTVNGQNVS